MKDEELLKRMNESGLILPEVREARIEDERSYNPPLFECRVSDLLDKNNDGVWKLQSAEQVVDMFPWTKSLIVTCAHDFSLELTEDRCHTKIERVA